LATDKDGRLLKAMVENSLDSMRFAILHELSREWLTNGKASVSISFVRAEDYMMNPEFQESI